MLDGPGPGLQKDQPTRTDTDTEQPRYIGPMFTLLGILIATKHFQVVQKLQARHLQCDHQIHVVLARRFRGEPFWKERNTVRAITTSRSAAETSNRSWCYRTVVRVGQVLAAKTAVRMQLSGARIAGFRPTDRKDCQAQRRQRRRRRLWRLRCDSAPLRRRCRDRPASPESPAGCDVCRGCP